MPERGGYYALHADGTETREEFDLPDGTTVKMIEAMARLPRPEPYFLISPKMLALLRKA